MTTFAGSARFGSCKTCSQVGVDGGWGRGGWGRLHLQLFLLRSALGSANLISSAAEAGLGLQEPGLVVDRPRLLLESPLHG